MGVAGKFFQTAGISALPLADQSAIREKVETFNTFTSDNDPHGEHDFGAFEHDGKKIFWKIDYYDGASFGTGRDIGKRRSERSGHPAVEVVIYRAPGREILRDRTPRATRAQDVHQPV